MPWPSGPVTSTFRLVRAGSLPENPADAATRVDEFTALAHTQSPILVVARDEGEIAQFLVLSGKGNHHGVADSLGHAVAAKAVVLPEDEQLALSGSAVQRLMVPVWRYQTGRSTLAGQNPYEVAQRAAASLREDGQWLAVTFRAPSGRERAKWDLFMESRDVQTHHSREHGAVMASFFAGGANAKSNRDVLVSLASAMPGFDEITNPSGVGFGSSLTRAIAAVAVGALIAAGVVMGVRAAAAPVWAATTSAGFPVNIGPFAMLLAIVPVLIGIGFALRPAMRALRMRAAAIPVYAPPRRMRTRDPEEKRLENGTVQRQKGERPLRRDVFKVSPVSFVGVLAPHVGSESGSSMTRERSAPSEVTQGRVGFVFGTDRRGNRVQLPAVSTYEGTAVVGQAGRGKSRLQTAQFAHQLQDRASPCGLPGFPGKDNTMIFFDTKGDTWPALQRWCEQFGVESTVIHVADDPWETLDEAGDHLTEPPRRQNSDVIDVLWSRGDADRRARYIADMMKQTLDEGSVQGQSLETLTKVFTGALALTPDMVAAARTAARADGVPFLPEGQPVTAVSLAWAFLGDPDVRAGELLFAQLAAAAQSDRARGLSSDAVLGEQALSSLYGPGVTAAARRPLLQAPRNKVSLMQTAPHFWDIGEHDSEVGSFRPGSEASNAQRAETRTATSAPMDLVPADATAGFTTVSNPFANVATVDDPDLLQEVLEEDAPVPADEPGIGEVPGRGVFSWDQLLTKHRVVIINSGVAPTSGTQMTEEGTELVTSIIFFSLVRAIQRVASGWRDEGRRISIMGDELSMVAAENAKTIEWLREKGRSYGVELSWGTQRPGQLPPKVLESLFGFGTLIAFAQDNPDVADTIARNLAGDGSQWSGHDVVNLPEFNVIVRTRSKQRLPAFTGKLTNFEEDREKFKDYQTGAAPLPGEKDRG